MRRHYESLADAVDVPIVVQDFPAGSGVYMTPAFIGALAADIPSCRWLKLEDDPTAPEGHGHPRGQPRTSASSAAWAATSCSRSCSAARWA